MANIISKTCTMMRGEWKLYGGVFLVFAVMMVLVVGVPSADTAIVSGVLMAATWLVSIFLTRHLMAGEKLKVRDAMYNALSPLASLLVVLVVMAVQLLPMLILLVAYSSAVETNLFSNAGHTIGFALFSVVMLALEWYLLPSSVMASVAVSAPGLYPGVALRTAGELIRGKRVRFWLASLVLMMVLAVICGVIVAPVIVMVVLGRWGITTVAVQILVSVAVVLATELSAVYYYIYYREMLDVDASMAGRIEKGAKVDKKEVKNDKRRGSGKN